MGRLLFPNLTWQGSRHSNKVYLTFDDGPTPGVTDEVLSILAEYEAKATFFCLGRQVKEHGDLLQALVKAGHVVGNHGFAHLNGWSTDTKVYLADEEAGRQALIDRGIEPKYFRAAYGKLNLGALPMLKKRYHRVVMWDLLPHDYDTKLSADEVYNNVVQQVKPGSIIVLHDSEKAAPNMLAVLPRILQHLSNKNYKFATLKEIEEY